MVKLFDTLRRLPKAIIITAALGGYLLFSIIADAGNGGLGSVGGIFSLLLMLALSGALIVALFLRKDSVARVLGLLVFGYFIIMTLTSLLPNFMNMMSLNQWAFVVAGIFALIAFLSLAGAFVLYILGLFVDLSGKGPFGLIRNIALLGFLGSVLMMILFYFIGLCIVGANWTSHFTNLSVLCLSGGVFFGFLYLL